MYKYEFTGERPIKTKSGLVIASDFVRIVYGSRGAYVEFDGCKLITTSLHIVSVHHYYYIEYATTDNIKVYFQLHMVNYADYIRGMWYIAPTHLQGFIRAERYFMGVH
jgi:hypothetical protein